VSLTAREAAWIQVSADGKPTFTGTLMPNQTKAVSAAGQVRVLTGNAGALTISLNGRTLESLGPTGQVREVRLTAEGPQFRSKAPQPEPDPL
jgi:cytoskeleton protein RodZ